MFSKFTLKLILLKDLPLLPQQLLLLLLLLQSQSPQHYFQVQHLVSLGRKQETFFNSISLLPLYNQWNSLTQRAIGDQGHSSFTEALKTRVALQLKSVENFLQRAFFGQTQPFWKLSPHITHIYNFSDFLFAFKINLFEGPSTIPTVVPTLLQSSTPGMF